MALAARFNYVCDNFDPLRRVYPFLDAGGRTTPLIGMPLSRIPCPCGAIRSYAEHFLAPFLASLRRRCASTVELERADEMYASGRMNRVIGLALQGRDRIAAILEELTGKKTDAAWSPFNPAMPGVRPHHARRP